LFCTDRPRLPSSTFSILDPNLVAYIDLTGSGAETISHIYENGRFTILFISLETSPRISRLFCRGRVVERGTAGFEEWTGRMGIQQVAKGARAIVVGEVFKTQTSCGFGVPLFQRSRSRTLTPPSDEKDEMLGDRDTLTRWGDKEVDKGQMDDYQAEWNSRSLDGLPGLRSARRFKGEWVLLGDSLALVKKMRQWEAFVLGVLVGWLLFGLVGWRGVGC
jgi:hypothetical protein